MLHFKLEGRMRSEFIDAVKEMEYRSIISTTRVESIGRSIEDLRRGMNVWRELS